MNKATLYHGDSQDILLELTPKTADLLITSPPYKDKDGYSDELIENVFYESFQFLKKNALCFVNFGHLAEDKMRPFTVASIIQDCGYILSETFIWIKNHYKPIQGNRRVNNLTEFVFMFYKGKMPKIDRLSIGIPYDDKTNAKRFAGGRDLKCRGNVWKIPYETIQSSTDKLHNDRFPIGLPDNCIKLSGLKSGTVFDPFAGSLTTGISARNHGLDFIGIEKNIKNCEISKKRYKDIFNEELEVITLPKTNNNLLSWSTNPEMTY